MKRGLKITTAVVLVLALLGGCAPKAEETETVFPSDSYQTEPTYTRPKPEPVETWAPYEFEAKAGTIEPVEGAERYFNNLPDVPEGQSIYDTTYLDFAFNTFKACCTDKDENVLISPASLLFALELSACGADGETLNEINSALFPGLSNEEALSMSLSYYEKLNDLSEGKLLIANGVFINSEYGDSVYKDYLDLVEQGFGAQIQTIDSSSESVDLVNRWVYWNTRGMIPKIMDEIDPSQIMLIVNALTFESAWTRFYEESDIEYNEKFLNSKGEKDKVNMLESCESGYFETDKAVGFMKYYHDYNFAFIVMLPVDDSISANEFIQNFTSDDYREFINSMEIDDIECHFPEFSYEYTNENMIEVFYNMGIQKVFSPGEADLSNTSDIEGLYVSSFLHKTFIEVNRQGTWAAAVTTSGTAIYSAPPPSLWINRPFVYMIVDTETMTPLFIGTVNSIDYRFEG